MDGQNTCLTTEQDWTLVGTAYGSQIGLTVSAEALKQ